MFLTNFQNCAAGVYYAASSDNDKELYLYSLRNNPEERSSQLLRGRSMKSCIVNPSKTKLRPLYLKTQSYRAINTFHLGYKNQSVYDKWHQSLFVLR